MILQRVFKWKGSKRHNNQTVWNLNVRHWDNEVRHREKTIGGSDVVACKCGCPYTKKKGSRLGNCVSCLLQAAVRAAWEDMIEYQRGIWSKSLAARNLITRPCSLQRKNHDALARTAASVGQKLKLAISFFQSCVGDCAIAQLRQSRHRLMFNYTIPMWGIQIFAGLVVTMFIILLFELSQYL